MFRKLVPLSALILAALLAGGPASGTSPSGGLEGIPAYTHVAIIVLENENEATTFGPGSPAKYLRSLVPQGTFDPNYYGTGHVSLDNYIAMTSAQPANPLTSSDCEANNFYSCVQVQQVMSNGRNIADQLEDAKLSWKEYADGTFKPCVHAAYDPTDPMPDPYQGDGSSPGPDAGPDYADRHNPFVYYDDIVGNEARCAAHVRPYTDLAGDLANDAVPSLAFISPDTCHDGHDATCSNGSPGGLKAADAWLRTNVPPLLTYLQSHDGLLIITFDEADPSSDWSGCCHGGPGGAPGFGGKIGLLALGDDVAAGKTVTTSYDHASLLRTLEDAFGISTYLNNAAQSQAMADLFAPPEARSDH